MKFIAVLSCCLMIFGCNKKNVSVFVIGGYTDSKHASGIHVYGIDFDNKRASLLQSLNTIESPSFLTFDNTQTKLFGVSETLSGKVFRFEFNGKTLNYKESIPLHENDPCHISYTKDALLISNYSSGSFSKIALKNGVLGDLHTVKLQGKGRDSIRQTAPYAHALYPSPWDKTMAYGVDLGTDKILTYDIQTLNITNFVNVSGGLGVRHLAFHPKNKWVYAVNELNSTITTFYAGAQGKLSEKSTISTLTKDITSYCGEIQVHPNGKTLYASNRGENTIAVFDIDPQTGLPKLRKSYSTNGDWPRFFMLTKDAKHLLVGNQKSNTVIVFELNNNGDIGKSILKFEVNAPSCILEKTAI